MKDLLSRIYSLTPPGITRALLRRLNPTFSIGTAGVFFSAAGTVLLLRHVYRRRYPWGLPSGFLSAGETPEAGIARELAEEAGLTARVEGVVGLHFIHRRHLEITLRGTVDDTQPFRLSHEIFEAAFFSVDALPADMAPDQREIARAAAHGSPAVKPLACMEALR